METVEIEVTDEVRKCLLTEIRNSIDDTSATFLDEITEDMSMEQVHSLVGQAVMNAGLVKLIMEHIANEH